MGLKWSTAPVRVPSEQQNLQSGKAEVWKSPLSGLIAFYAVGRGLVAWDPFILKEEEFAARWT